MILFFGILIGYQLNLKWSWYFIYIIWTTKWLSKCIEIKINALKLQYWNISFQFIGKTTKTSFFKNSWNYFILTLIFTRFISTIPNYNNLKLTCTRHATIFEVVTIRNLDYKDRILHFFYYFMFYLLLVHYHPIITYLTK